MYVVDIATDVPDMSCMATMTTYVVGVATDFSDMFACQALCQVTDCLFDGNNDNIVGIAKLHSSPVCLPGNCRSLMATMSI
jgi:hypothetical protein